MYDQDFVDWDFLCIAGSRHLLFPLRIAGIAGKEVIAV
jgi:hypothetical protein